MSEPIRVLFVCTANICRSPFMEIYARSLAGDGVVVSSAGTYGMDSQELSADMAAELTRRGLVTEEFRSRPLTSDLLAEADLVLCAERSHRQFILDDHPQHFRKVFTVGQVLAALESAEAELRGRRLLAELAQRRGTAAAAGDIADPYGRGAAAAATAAELITGMLDRIVPRLTETPEQELRAHG